MSAEITLAAQPSINPMYMFRWEEQEDAFVLLYPEGIVKLNQSAGQILNLCDGERTIADIVTALEDLFETQGLEADVMKFMEVSFDKDWIRFAA